MWAGESGTAVMLAPTAGSRTSREWPAGGRQLGQGRPGYGVVAGRQDTDRRTIRPPGEGGVGIEDEQIRLIEGFVAHQRFELVPTGRAGDVGRLVLAREVTLGQRDDGTDLSLVGSSAGLDGDLVEAAQTLRILGDPVEAVVEEVALAAG